MAPGRLVSEGPLFWDNATEFRRRGLPRCVVRTVHAVRNNLRLRVDSVQTQAYPKIVAILVKRLSRGWIEHCSVW